jgi:hypothetical protein
MAKTPKPAPHADALKCVAAINDRYRGRWDALDLTVGSAARSQLAFDIGYLTGLAETLLRIIPAELVDQR